MGLAWQQGPLAPRAAGRFVVPGPLPGRLLYAEPVAGAHLRAGDGGGAALEMERHLRAPLYMWRLALPGSQAIAGEVVT